MEKALFVLYMWAASAFVYGQTRGDIKDYREALDQLSQGGLSAEQGRTALAMVVEALSESDDPRILLVLRQEMKKNPLAIKTVVPRVTALVKAKENESRLCDLLDLLLAVGQTAPEGVVELEAIVKDVKKYSFGAPRAAVLLLSVDPSRRDMAQWLGGALESENRELRLATSLALGIAGKRVQPMASKLVPLFRDSAVEVRVVTAGALWKIAPKTPGILDVLRESLTEKAALMRFKPEGVSSRGTTHHDLALIYMGEMGKEARRAVNDIARFVKAEAGPARLFAVRSLALIGVVTPDVLAALEAARGDSNEAVAAAAAEALDRLRRRD